MTYIYQVICEEPLFLAAGSNQLPMVIPAKISGFNQALIVRDKLIIQEDPNKFYPTITLELIEHKE